MVAIVLAAFAAIVAFQLAVTGRAWRIAKKWRAPKSEVSWGDISTGRKVVAVISCSIPLAVAVLIAVAAR
ncbi:MAG TPA: hypothetical protein VH061_00720 [Solirubrobacteraceae bacterium]|jgi:hypothetical protein|nr:hypothetical protein [Solirubrobacteraceae bacterium]